VTVFYVYLLIIPSFRLKDNSVHLHEWYPFRVGIFKIVFKENYSFFSVLCRHADYDIVLML